MAVGINRVVGRGARDHRSPAECRSHGEYRDGDDRGRSQRLLDAAGGRTRLPFERGLDRLFIDSRARIAREQLD